MRFSKVVCIGSIFCLLSSCSGTNNPPQSVSSTVESAPKGEIQLLESRLAAKIELNRKAAGLSPMTHHSGMASLARQHSDQMAKKFIKSGKRVLNHDGFASRGSTMLLDYSMSEVAENVAYVWGVNGDPAAKLNENWMNSKGHRKNILKKWNYTGVGVAICPDGTIYATQLFGSKTGF